MPFLDEVTVERLRRAEREWWDNAMKNGCPNCGAKLAEFPPEANVFPHMTGACKDKLTQLKWDPEKWQWLP